MTKKWGAEEFWGLGADFDPQWLLTDEQKKIQALIIDLAQKEMRDNAIESDKKLLFPRKNFQILAKHGLLGLLVPKDLGGMMSWERIPSCRSASSCARRMPRITVSKPTPRAVWAWGSKNISAYTTFCERAFAR